MTSNARQRPPSRVGEPLSQLLARFDPEGRLRAYRLWDFWDEVVGAAIAERAQPLRLRDGVLMVRVATHTWMQELQFLKQDICARLNERLDVPLLTDLQFVLGPLPERRAPVAPPPLPLVPVAVPELPSTGSPELDEALRRVATAAARRRAADERPKKRGRGRKT